MFGWPWMLQQPCQTLRVATIILAVFWFRETRVLRRQDPIVLAKNGHPGCPGGYCTPFPGPHIGLWCGARH